MSIGNSICWLLAVKGDLFSVDKKLQFNQIGLFVGKLEKVEIVNENMKFYCFCRKVKEEDATYTFKTSNLLDRVLGPSRLLYKFVD